MMAFCANRSRQLLHKRYTNAYKKVIGAAYSSNVGERDFLHNSVLPTDHFQKSLPRLPVPKLEDTCMRYLASQKAFQSENKIKETEKIVADFQTGAGKELHEQLVAQDKANKHTSYISGPWYDMYLKDRRAVTLNHNPFMSFANDERPGYNSQLVKAANVIISGLRFRQTLAANVLEPEVYHLNAARSDNDNFRRFCKMLPKSLSWYGAYWYKAFPLDMSQFSKLFNGTRIPRPVKDELYQDVNGKHILVLRNGNLYVFDCFDQDGNIKPASEILACLQYILQLPASPAEYPLGVFTTQDRDTWTAKREELERSGNQETLKKVDSALFALVLDDCNYSESEVVATARNFLHSDGCNRWYDKSFSVIIQQDGQAAVNFEHSWGDGVAVLRFMNEVYKEMMNRPQVGPDTKPANIDASQFVNKLEFNLTDDLKNSLKEAQKGFQSTIDGLDMNYLLVEDGGKNLIKQHKLSPDSFMQLAIQLGYLRQTGAFGASYESCSTSAFKHGRTETVRPLSVAMEKACQLFNKKGSDVGELHAAMKECSDMHNQLTKEAAMGQGWDRHLFALRYLSGSNMPALFQDPSYSRINHIVLSTSTLSSPATHIGAFGPVVKDGYGCGYAIMEDQMGFMVTAYKAHRDLAEYLQCVEGAVKDMKGVLDGRSPTHA